MDAKRLLRIERVREGEHDRFAGSRELLTTAAASLAGTVHLAYVGRYFMERPAGVQGPSSLVLSCSIVGSLIGALAFSIIVLSRRENSAQAKLLRERLLDLAALERVDLSARTEILNFDDIGFVSDAFNAYSESLRRMIGEIGDSNTVLDALLAASSPRVSPA